MRMYLAPPLTHSRVQSLSLSPGIMCLAPHMESPMLPTKVLAESLPVTAKLRPIASNNPKTEKVNLFMPTSTKFGFLERSRKSDCPTVPAVRGRGQGTPLLDVEWRFQVT